MAEMLRQSRKAAVYQVACSSPRNAQTELPLHLLGDYSSLNAELVIPGMRPQGAVLVVVRTLDDILSEARAPTPIDLLSVDVEGHEIEVLEGFDFERWRPRLVLIEDHIATLDLHRTLKQRGYKWYPCRFAHGRKLDRAVSILT
jgi:FkbM family methyltransferase